MAIPSNASQPKADDKTWQSLTSDEKLERRFAAWLSAGNIEFATPQAEADYKARAKRYADAVRLKNVPDRVPVVPSLGDFAASYYGYTNKDMMYDVDKVVDVRNMEHIHRRLQRCNQQHLAKGWTDGK